MNVILMEKVDNLGDLGEKVSVKSGYARNFLVPTGKAKFATADNLAAFETMRAELEKNAAEATATAEARKTAVEALSLVIAGKAGTEGKLFGSIGPREIADVITAAGVAVEKKEVRMPEGPLRALGEFEISLHFHTDVNLSITVKVEAEE